MRYSTDGVRPALRRLTVSFAVIVPLLAAGGFAARPVAAQTTRDPWLWPFAVDSIWNTPLGDGATYINAGITNDWGISIDVEHFVKTTTADPFRTVYYPGAFDNRDTGTTVSWLGQMRVPDSLIIPDAVNENGVYSTPNDCSTFLQPDGRTIYQLEPTTRTTQGGPVWGYPQTDWGQYPTEGSLYGQGERGTHYGSGLSAIGGSIRLGELTGTAAIRHALKVNLRGQSYYYYSRKRPGYRWPARNADGYASTRTYGGTNPELCNGSLLALPRSTTAAALGIESEAGLKLFHAFRDYGAYVVDDTGWYTNAICAEKGVEDEVRARYGYGIQGERSGASATPVSRDLGRIFRALHVITNNSPTSKGGPGNRVAPPAPPLP